MAVNFTCIFFFEPMFVGKTKKIVFIYLQNKNSRDYYLAVI